MNTNLVHGPGLLTRCDEEGVPCVVQAIWYRRSDMKFEVLFFNGQTRFFLEEELLPHDVGMDIMADEPTDEQFVIAEQIIEWRALDAYPWMFRTSLRRAAPMLRRV